MEKKVHFFAFVMVCFFSAVITPVFAGDTFDDSIYVARSNVVASQVDPSFWDERESLTIEKVKKPLQLPTGTKYFIPECPDTSGTSDLTAQELAIIGKSQEVALMLINIPDYLSGVPVFKLDDKQQVQLSSAKYAATNEYYGRTDISSSWITGFYQAAYCNDFGNLTRLLDELPPEV
jgi:hypothetical protein